MKLRQFNLRKTIQWHKDLFCDTKEELEEIKSQLKKGFSAKIISIKNLSKYNNVVCKNGDIIPVDNEDFYYTANKKTECTIYVTIEKGEITNIPCEQKVITLIKNN